MKLILSFTLIMALSIGFVSATAISGQDTQATVLVVKEKKEKKSKRKKKKCCSKEACCKPGEKGKETQEEKADEKK